MPRSQGMGAGRDPRPAPRVQVGTPGPYLLPISINGIACDPDTVGGASRIDRHWEPADDQDPRGGPWLDLHIQGGVRWT